MATLKISQEEYQKLRDSGVSQSDIIARYSKSEPAKNAGFYDKYLGSQSVIGKAAQGVTNFVGAGGIAEQYGASGAEAYLRATGQKEAAQQVQYPTMRRVVGSAIQTGANLIPGAGVGAGLATKVGIGAATGYAMDVGANLQLEREGTRAFRPGIGTVTGAAIPVIGKILGLTTKNLPASIAKKLEDTNLRLTPVERQNLAKKGQDIANFLAQKKVVGTPQARFAKVSALYDDMERQIQRTVGKSGITYPTRQIIDDVNKIPDGFIDDPELMAEARNTVARLVASLETRGESLSAPAINELKRTYMKRAFAKNATDVVSDSRLAIGANFKRMLDTSIKELQPLNNEYGMIIASRRALQKALSRAQIGLVGKLAGTAASMAVGNMISPGVGAAAGAIAGPQIAKATMGTLPRSAVGAGFQTVSNIAAKIQSLPTDRLGNISKKALLNYLESLKTDQQ